MTIWAKNKGDAATYLRESRGTLSQITLTPFIDSRPTANQKMIITGLYFYRGAGGATARYTITLEDNNTLADLGVIVIIPPVAGGEFSYENPDMVFAGGLGQVIRAVFVAGDVVTCQVRMNYIIP